MTGGDESQVKARIKIYPRGFVGLTLAISLIAVATGKLRADSGTCGGAAVTVPFNDVGGSIFFCQIAASYFSGLTNGTSGTTYSPDSQVTREQMAAFITRTIDQSVRRGSRRAALGQFWTPTIANSLKLTNVGNSPMGVASDGADLWVANSAAGTVSRVRASDGRVLQTWTGATQARAVLVTYGRVYVAGSTSPGHLYVIDPSLAPGPVQPVSNILGDGSAALASDGSSIWTANSATVSMVNPIDGARVSFGGYSAPTGVLYDGSNIWVSDAGTDNFLLKLDSNGSIIQAVNVGAHPSVAAFDGTNIWVPNTNDNSITVVRASTGAVLATLTGNGLSGPTSAVFDGERILVTNSSDSVSLWTADALTSLGSFPTGNGSAPSAACSDGINFWITLAGHNQLARF
jgi:hypothetical protein